MNSWNTEKKEISVRFCGSGGGGIILSSVILGKSAIYDNKNAIQTQSYGAEQRGTKVKSDVVISENEAVNYPVGDKVDILIAFSQEAFDFYFSSVKNDGLILINSDLIQFDNKDVKLYKIPANTLATELNNERFSNMIVLGALIKITNIVSKDSLIKAVSDTVPEKYTEINVQAFQKGYDYIK